MEAGCGPRTAAPPQKSDRGLDREPRWVAMGRGWLSAQTHEISHIKRLSRSLSRMHLFAFVRPSQVENYWRSDAASISACCGRLVSRALIEQPPSYSLGSARKRRSATTDTYQPVVIATHSAISFPPSPPTSESAQKWADEKLLHFRVPDLGPEL